MKSIDELINDLKNHPDFLYAQIFCKSEVVDYIVEYVEDEEGIELDRKSVEAWVKQTSSDAVEDLQDFLCEGYKWDNPFNQIVDRFTEQFITPLKEEQVENK